MDAKNKQITNTKVAGNGNPSTSSSNTSIDINTPTVTSNNSNTKSSMKLKKRLFANLIVDFDKKLIPSSNDILNVVSSNNTNLLSNHLIRINSTSNSMIDPSSTSPDYVGNARHRCSQLESNDRLFTVVSSTVRTTSSNTMNAKESTTGTNDESLCKTSLACNNSVIISPVINLIHMDNCKHTITHNRIDLKDMDNKATPINIDSNSPTSTNNLMNNIPTLPANITTCDSSDTLTIAPATNYPNFSNSFSTTIYRKPTFTGLITKWQSSVPHSYEVSTISSMVYRAIRICSSYKSMHEEFEFIEFLAKLNGYPVGFVKSQIRKTLDRYIVKTNGSKETKTLEEDVSSNKRRISFDIPFFGKPTDIFKKQITKIAKAIDPMIILRPILRPPASSSQYFPIKDPIPKLLKSKVVYKLNCSDCDATYIGKTVRHVSTRLQEHGDPRNKTDEIDLVSPNPTVDLSTLRRSERNKNKTVQYFPHESSVLTIPNHSKETYSAVKQHERVGSHKIDWNNFDILASDNKNYQLLVKESLIINILKPILNRTTSSVPLIIFPEGIQTERPKVKIKS